MKNLDQLRLNEMEELLSSSRKVTWQTEDHEAKYDWIAAVLKAQRYAKLGKREKGVVRRFLQKVTATSRAQKTRLIGQWLENRKIVRRTATRPAFTVRYTREDIVLLAAADEDLGVRFQAHFWIGKCCVTAVRATVLRATAVRATALRATALRSEPRLEGAVVSARLSLGAKWLSRDSPRWLFVRAFCWRSHGRSLSERV